MRLGSAAPVESTSQRRGDPPEQRLPCADGGRLALGEHALFGFGEHEWREPARRAQVVGVARRARARTRVRLRAPEAARAIRGRRSARRCRRRPCPRSTAAARSRFSVLLTSVASRRCAYEAARESMLSISASSNSASASSGGVIVARAPRYRDSNVRARAIPASSSARASSALATSGDRSQRTPSALGPGVGISDGRHGPRLHGRAAPVDAVGNPRGTAAAPRFRRGRCARSRDRG